MKSRNVIIIGGGIAGLTAARHIARHPGYHVDLIEKNGMLGGHAIDFACKATNECQRCNACTVEEILRDAVRDPDIDIHRYCTIKQVTRRDRLQVILERSPVRIRPDRCTNCGACMEDCPNDAILIGSSRHQQPRYGIDIALCRPEQTDAENCRICEETCPEQAIRIEPSPDTLSLTGDSIIVATGFTPFNPEAKPTYGYKQFKNVITTLELDRIMKRNGSITRPSDDHVPKKIAFIQCVGSRDEHIGHLWCSRVCCGNALRSAEMIQHRHPNTETTVFYMDIQNTDREFPKFYKQCKSDLSFVRSIPVDIYAQTNGNLRLRYLPEDAGTTKEDEFDLVVLSIGIMPPTDAAQLSETLGISLNPDGFFNGIDHFNQSITNRPGIFLAGTAEGPKSIAASMAQAGQAASDVFDYLGE